ncbi:MAG: hypothetical protein AAF497_18525, partial [Planctomycetota bacterium]
MFQTVFQLSDDPQLLVDEKDKVLHTNGAFESSFGPTQPNAEWWTAFDCELTSSKLKKLPISQTQDEVRIECHDGSSEHFLVSCQKFEINGQRVTHIRFRNIEPLVRRQELLEHAMESTAARIGDQYFEQALRTLISAFKMQTAFIARLSKDGKSAEMVSFIVGDKLTPNVSYTLE